MMIVNDKERLQLEEELLMTCSKSQAINKYIDELEESSKLSELWCKSQEENRKYKEVIDNALSILRNELYKSRCRCDACNDYFIENLIKLLEQKEVE